jgi:hypothetical protein
MPPDATQTTLITPDPFRQKSKNYIDDTSPCHKWHNEPATELTWQVEGYPPMSSATLSRLLAHFAIARWWT